jgi:hypothetical protein
MLKQPSHTATQPKHRRAHLHAHTHTHLLVPSLRQTVQHITELQRVPSAAVTAAAMAAAVVAAAAAPFVATSMVEGQRQQQQPPQVAGHPLSAFLLGLRWAHDLGVRSHLVRRYSPLLDLGAEGKHGVGEVVRGGVVRVGDRKGLWVRAIGGNWTSA